MPAYILVYLAIVFSTFGSLSYNKQIKTAFLFITVTVLFLVLGFRSEFIGVDTPSYYAIYNLINSEWFSGEFGNWEPGFVIVNKFIHFIGGDAKYAILALALINLTFIGLFIKDTSPNYTLSLILFVGLSFYFNSFNIIRQAIAVSIICYAFRYLYYKNYITWTMLYILALSFHTSALIFLIYFLTPIIKNRTNTILALWITSLLFIISPNLIRSLISFVSFLIPGQYLVYIDYLEEAKSLRLRMLASQLFFITFFYYYKRITPSINKELALVSMLGIILINTLTFSGYIYRLALFFAVFQIVTLPIVINYFFRSKSRYIVNSVVFFIMTVLYFRSLLSSSQEQYPYHTWLSLLNFF